MTIDTKEPIILSIGGSLIVPANGINTSFLIKFNEFIRQHVQKGRKFFLITGGGSTARNYIDGAKKIVSNLTDEELDWLGIRATHLNAHLLQTILRDIAHPKIIDNYEKKIEDWHESVIIGAGWKPGWSTDYDAVVVARDYNISTIINLSNIDWVYDKNPHEYSDAKPFEKISWQQMQELVGSDWTPGENIPFDPKATKLASEIGITVVITNGEDLANVSSIIDGNTYKGTTITS